MDKPMTNRRATAIIKSLKKVEWRLNFTEQRGLCDSSIVSARGAKLPRILANIQRSMMTKGGTKAIHVPDDVITLPEGVGEFYLLVRKDFIELTCSGAFLNQLVQIFGIKIRCNYQLEALEQMLVIPLRRYREIAILSDGKWNQMPAFRTMLNPGVHDFRREAEEPRDPRP